MRIPGISPRPQPAPATYQGTGGVPPYVPPAQTQAPPPELQTPVAQPVVPAGPPRIGLLLPLSGPNAGLGASMLNAAQMALFDAPDVGASLLPRDSGGTAERAAAAAQDVIIQGARVIVGPLLAAEVEAVKPIAAAANVPVIAFSTATQFAGNGVFLMGFQPSQEVVRVAQFARAKGMQRFAAIAPSTPYGDLAVQALKDAVGPENVVKIGTYDPGTTDLAPVVKRFAAGAQFDAVLVPEGGNRLKLLAPLLPYNGIDPDTVKYLGTGLWDEPGLGTEPALNTGWYAAPPSEARSNFNRRYREAYHQAPPRLATLSYDATALVAALMQSGDVSIAALTNPSGFAGIDGIFRFLPSGVIQRGLAVLEVRRGDPVVVDPSPTDFQNLGQ